MALPTRLLALAFGVLLTAASLPDLFRKSKEQFQIGAYTDALQTLAALDKASREPGMESDRAALLPGLLFYRGASLAALRRTEEAEKAFEEYLALQPNTALDPARYPRTVLVAFENAKKGVTHGPARSGDASLAARYAEFPRPDLRDVEKPNEGWAEGPVRFLLTTEEKREFSRLGDTVARSEFVTTFWKGRDPRPETVTNEFREEFSKRVAFADAHFSQDEVRGSLTDRGMVFVLLGPPSYSGRKQLRTGDDIADAPGLSRYSRSELAAAEQGSGSSTSRLQRIDRVSGPGTTVDEATSNWMETWHYLRKDLPREIPNQELEFQFVTKVGYGKNVLQRESLVVTALERAKMVARRGQTPPRS